jgi:hypothetical protein
VPEIAKELPTRVPDLAKELPDIASQVQERILNLV